MPLQEWSVVPFGCVTAPRQSQRFHLGSRPRSKIQVVVQMYTIIAMFRFVESNSLLRGSCSSYWIGTSGKSPQIRKQRAGATVPFCVLHGASLRSLNIMYVCVAADSPNSVEKLTSVFADEILSMRICTLCRLLHVCT